VVLRSVVVAPVNGLAPVAMMFSSMPGSMPFGFFGFPFFCGDFGAELHVFFVFNRAAIFFGFGLVAFLGFRFFRFVFGGGDGFAWEVGHAQRVRRGGRRDQREQQEDEQEGKELAHRPFIGAAAGLL
jgi:hypothetical protein